VVVESVELGQDGPNTHHQLLSEGQDQDYITMNNSVIL
jgi:hypothetical protein